MTIILNEFPAMDLINKKSCFHRKKNRKRLKPVSGFTLIELMIVVAIIAILSAAAAFSYVSSKDRARAVACVASTHNIRKGMETYYADNGRYIDAAGSLDELLTELEPYMNASSHGKLCEFVSYSSDGQTFETVSKVGRTSGNYIKITATQDKITQEAW